MMNGLILVPILLPVLGGLILLIRKMPERSDAGYKRSVRKIYAYTTVLLAVSAASALFCAWTGERSLTLFTLLKGIPVYFCVDALGRWFVTIVSLVWLASGFFAFAYMEHEENIKQYFGFYLMVYGALTALAFSGNLVTLYLFYELTTLVSVPLVLHNRTREALMAALKYLFYSMCGAYGGLFGIFFLYRYCETLTFQPGGTLEPVSAAGNEGILLAAVFVMLVGFGAKAGMLPLHGWLPVAHPAAPAPASAALSGVIVKAGVLAMIRAVYYVVGPEFLRGTWVQYAWMILALLTVFMGSMLAYRQQGLKKRLAYSTVSQVSYITFGLSLLTPLGIQGALLHVAVHAVIKCGLFLTAGVFVQKYGASRVDELTAAGKRMPAVMCCFTLFSLGLIGIPPFGGFISKWYLAQGAMQADVGVFSWLGPVVLLISALLTAGYLLPIAVKGFFPGKPEGAAGKAEGESAGKAEGAAEKRKEPGSLMLWPLVLLAGLTLLMGLIPGPLVRYAAEIAEAVLR